jgi:hypothetical protein
MKIERGGKRQSGKKIGPPAKQQLRLTLAQVLDVGDPALRVLFTGAAGKPRDHGAWRALERRLTATRQTHAKQALNSRRAGCEGDRREASHAGDGAWGCGLVDSGPATWDE